MEKKVNKTKERKKEVATAHDGIIILKENKGKNNQITSYKVLNK